jgi:acyl transferase domain-containing protein
MGGLAGNGRCKTFDESADGFARGEGVGSVALMPQSRAEKEGREILALCRGTAVGQDGKSATITAPSGPAQEKVIQNALKDAELKGEDVSYIECHGTGTALGDPIETRSLMKMYGKGRTESKPLVLGAVKSCITHLEGAAGIAGLIKVVMATKHRKIPPNLHLNKMNPNIDLQGVPVVMPAKVEEWNASVLRAGISSFGFSGTNSHVIIEEAPKKKAAPADGAAEVTPREPIVWEHKSYATNDWAKGLWYSTTWEEKKLAASKPSFTADAPCLIIGEGEVARSILASVENAMLLVLGSELDLSASPMKADLTKAEHVAAF